MHMTRAADAQLRALPENRLDWRAVRLEDIGEFAAWLRLPPPGRSGAVAVLPSAEPQVAARRSAR